MSIFPYNFSEQLFSYYDMRVKDTTIRKLLFWRKPKDDTDIRYEVLKTDVDEIRNCSSLDFDTLFNFGTFIRDMEKVFFYHNDETSTVSCDSNTENTNARNIYINIDDTIIKLNLKVAVGPDNSRNEHIDVTVQRNFGKKMTNKFHIVNRECKFSNKTDVILMDRLNIIIANAVADFYLQYIELVHKIKIQEAV